MTASRFELIPAIDLLGGKCVRLAQGRYDAATVYDADPAAAARRFAAHAVPQQAGVDVLTPLPLDADPVRVAQGFVVA